MELVHAENCATVADAYVLIEDVLTVLVDRLREGLHELLTILLSAPSTANMIA